MAPAALKESACNVTPVSLPNAAVGHVPVALRAPRHPAAATRNE